MYTLLLFTDASVRGESWVVEPDGSQRRSKYGPAGVGWVGRFDAEHTGRPPIVGHAFVGRLGIQGAEYHGVIYGLHAVYAFIQCTPHRPAVVVNLDNIHVVEQLNGRRSVIQMRPFHAAARRAVHLIEQHGVSVQVRWVPRENAQHRAANRLARTSFEGLLEPAHRPQWPPRVAASSGTITPV